MKTGVFGGDTPVRSLKHEANENMRGSCLFKLSPDDSEKNDRKETDPSYQEEGDRNSPP